MKVQVLASSSAGNATLLDDPDAGLLLLDAGLSFPRLQKAIGFRVSHLAGCLVSHEHGDHCLAVPKLVRAGVEVFGTAGTIASMPWSGSSTARHRLNIVETLEPFAVGGYNVLALPTTHDAAEPCAFLIASPTAKVLYATDTPLLEYRFGGLTHILIEANYSLAELRRRTDAGELEAVQANRVIRNHFSIERALDLLRATDLTRVEEIHLLHLSDGNGDEAGFKRLAEEATGLPVYVAPR